MIDAGWVSADIKSMDAPCLALSFTYEANRFTSRLPLTFLLITAASLT